MKRIGEMVMIRPEGLELYKKYHADPLPGVNEMIKACNIQNYSIFQRGEYMFAYYEYVGDDYEKDMAIMAADPTTQLWWKETRPCFLHHEEGWYYDDLQEIFYLE